MLPSYRLNRYRGVYRTATGYFVPTSTNTVATTT